MCDFHQTPQPLRAELLELGNILPCGPVSALHLLLNPGLVYSGSWEELEVF